MIVFQGDWERARKPERQGAYRLGINMHMRYREIAGLGKHRSNGQIVFKEAVEHKVTK